MASLSLLFLPRRTGPPNHIRGQRKPDAETRPFYQASIAFNMVAAMATAGFLGYYVAGSILSEDSHVCTQSTARLARLLRGGVRSAHRTHVWFFF